MKPGNVFGLILGGILLSILGHVGSKKNTSHMMPYVILLLITLMVRNVKGFTMVELMIVIAIIGVLAVALIPSLMGAQEKARDSARQANLKTISSAIEGFNSSEGAFPVLATATTTCTSTSTGQLTTFSGTTTQNLLRDNIKGGVFPIDPKKSTNTLCTAGGGAYGYKVINKDTTASGSYMISAKMETTKAGNVGVSYASQSDVSGVRPLITTGSGVEFVIFY